MVQTFWFSAMAILGILLGNSQAVEPGAGKQDITLENAYLRYVISAGGRCLHFIDKTTGKDYGVNGPIAKVKKEGRFHDLTSLRRQADTLIMNFAPVQVTAVVQVISKDRFMILNVVDVTGSGVEELVFCDIKSNLKGLLEDPFQACVLALNLQTCVNEIPGPTNQLQAKCYPRFGLVGAKAAILACPGGELRNIMKEAVQNTPELPKNLYGGPWALDAEVNRGSYLFDFGDVTEETVDDWIALIKNLGFKQLDFHGGKSFRFGDYRPNPEIYPDGLDSLKRIIDKLHEAGILAGLHTYAFFIDKKCPWVTPIPDPRLGKDAVFTLAKAIGKNDTAIEVLETTRDMSVNISFAERNSVTLQIGDELITYAAIDKEPPYAFAQCTRGAYGTRVAEHDAGTKVYHLKECFGLFAPDGDSSLLTEVAAKTAYTYNYCGFDMMYLDALDGSDVLGGGENAWHYSAKFTFELVKRLERPVVMEMSCFSHHLWYVRSRLGAWDCSARGHKTFIDFHCQQNIGRQGNSPSDHRFSSVFLPMNLGWWMISTDASLQNEPTYPDDVEYLCGKALAYDFSLAMMNLNPENYKNSPYRQRVASIFKNYETLRLQNYFSEEIKKELRRPGREFTLQQNPQGKWQFLPVRYDKHKVEKMDRISNVWKVENPFEPQPVRLRIEALMSAETYDNDNTRVLMNYDQNPVWHERACAEGTSVNFEVSGEQVKTGSVSGKLTASNTLGRRQGAWTRLTRVFSPPIYLQKHRGLGLWIHGDGKGEVLNFQFKNPAYQHLGIADHYVHVDFTGWRYVELIEWESDRYAEYDWPYKNLYEIYMLSVKYKEIESFSIWYNNLPPNDSVTCYLSPIRALPLVETKLVNPTITIAGQTLTFPVEMEAGGFLEFCSMSDCRLYDPNGTPMGSVTPEGEVPDVAAGINTIEFNATAAEDQVCPRAKVTIITHGNFLHEHK